ncbi:MAG TPA: PIN domain-containing protein [Candidatus Nanoarchaeia archaeon]|nr:PIN domain-containing protein [Candidatus Nanoarchaeia archaeon]
MKYFLDTYALIEIAEGNQAYQKFLESDVVTLKENLAELFYFLLKKYDEKAADFFLEKFSRITAELPISVIPKAMIFRYNHKKTSFSYIDCFGYVYALEDKRFFLTGDRAFKGMENVELVR